MRDDPRRRLFKQSKGSGRSEQEAGAGARAEAKKDQDKKELGEQRCRSLLSPRIFQTTGGPRLRLGCWAASNGRGAGAHNGECQEAQGSDSLMEDAIPLEDAKKHKEVILLRILPRHL